MFAGKVIEITDFYTFYTKNFIHTSMVRKLW